jgi:hypothetical protein
MYSSQVDCVGCHILPETIGGPADFTGTTFKASGLGCRGCHGEGYEGILDMWKAQIEEGLAKVKPLIGEAEKSLKRLEGADPKVARKARKLLTDARFNYNFVKFGKGIHNVNYSDALLKVARDNCNKVKELGRKHGKVARTK